MHLDFQYISYLLLLEFLIQRWFFELNQGNLHLIKNYINNIYFYFIIIKPGNKGVLPNSSAKMQPTEYISTAFEYSDAFKITSGALYQRVTTYLYL